MNVPDGIRPCNECGNAPRVQNNSLGAFEIRCFSCWKMQEPMSTSYGYTRGFLQRFGESVENVVKSWNYINPTHEELMHRWELKKKWDENERLRYEEKTK